MYIIPSTKRWCDQCKEMKARSGGKVILLDKGRRQRWICAGCKNSAK